MNSVESRAQVLRSTRIVTSTGVRDGAVVVLDGKISAILDTHEIPPDAKVVDLGTKVLGPGLVDSHVHINEPGREAWEGFRTATRAAASGGVTTVVDMPLNSAPVTTDRDALLRKVEVAQRELFVDCGFWGGAVPGNANELKAMRREGAMGAKAFLCHSGIDEFPNVTESDLRAALDALSDTGAPLIVHAELELGAGVVERDPRSYRSWLDSRPPSFEEAAVELLVRSAEELKARVHVVHLSAGSALRQIQEARARGVALTAETCPHYLTLAAEEIADGDTRFKCAPPIRERSNQAALWRGLREGTIDFVVSDHSPCTADLKKLEEGDFLAAWGGIASLSLGLPVLWTRAQSEGVSLEQLFRWLSSGPAEFLGLRGKKGAIEVGLDADFVVFDPDFSRVLSPEDVFFKNKVCPYFGRTLSGQIESTWLRGNRIFDRGGFVGSGPIGELLLSQTR